MRLPILPAIVLAMPALLPCEGPREPAPPLKVKHRSKAERRARRAKRRQKGKAKR
jgi:hypothetical protein